jgi:hypothetical protein
MGFFARVSRVFLMLPLLAVAGELTELQRGGGGSEGKEV